MEDRIQINGVWYVREALPQKDKKEIDLSPIEFIGIVHETDDYVWEATKVVRDDARLYDGIDIKFTDKTETPWKDDHWDNVSWILGVYENNPESIKEARESMNEDGVEHFQAFIKKLIKKEWLPTPKR